MTTPSLPSDEAIEQTYQEARGGVRDRRGDLNTSVAQQLRDGMRAWADQLEAGLGDLPPERRAAVLASATLTRTTSSELDAAVQQAAAEARDLAYSDVQ